MPSLVAAEGLMIDLHLHSRFSDGSEEPERVVELAAEAGCSAIALTDHDTLAGISRAQSRASELGVGFVSGCEITCNFPLGALSVGPPAVEAAIAATPVARMQPAYPTIEHCRASNVHVLAYFVAPDCRLAGELVSILSSRTTRNLELVDRLDSLGVPVPYDDVLEEAGGSESVGRPHFAAVMARRGYVADIDEAFDRWLGAGRPAYVPRRTLGCDELALIARESAVVLSLAHPLRYGFGRTELEALVGYLADTGFAALEAVYSAHSPAEQAFVEALAARYSMVVTGGSDFHGTYKEGISPGTGTGGLEAPDTILANLVRLRDGLQPPTEGVSPVIVPSSPDGG